LTTEERLSDIVEILAHGLLWLDVRGSVVGPLLQVTRNVPIVFVNAVDPVGAGFVDNLARPGGHVTGFTLFEYGISAKWLELLKEIAPRVTRAGVLRDPTLAAGPAQFAVIQAAAPSFGVEVRPINVHDAPEIERAVTAFARSSNGGLIVTGRDPIGLFYRPGDRYRLV
jgi:putative ABC transport system substrate-binding protein